MKTWLKRFAGAIVVIAGVMCVNRILEFILIDNISDEVRTEMHDFYNRDDIDTLFLGSSHVSNGYILDELKSGMSEGGISSCNSCAED